MLKAQNICKTFQTNKIKALQDFSLEIEKGEIMGLLGPNGAGKTTFVKIAVGVLAKDSGSISIFGYDGDKDRKKISENIAWIPQEGVQKMLYQKTGRENIIYYSWIRGLTRKETNLRIDKIMDQMLINKKVIDKPYRLMSGGQKQYVNIMNGLVMNADLIFCDEISVSIDPIISKNIYLYLKEIVEEGKTVLLTSQNIDEVEDLSNRVALINEGKIMTVDTPRKISRNILKYEIIDLIFERNVSEIPKMSEFCNELETHKLFLSGIQDNNKLRVQCKTAKIFLADILQLLDKYSLNPAIEAGKANLKMAVQLIKEENEA